MSFLFGKKKQTHNPLPPATRETHTSGGTGTTSSIPTANGTRGKDRGPGGAQSPPPGPQPGFLPGPASGSNVNSSLNSISEGKTPSPDHGLDQRGGMEQDASVCTLISIEMHCCTRSEAFASSTWSYMGLLTKELLAVCSARPKRSSSTGPEPCRALSMVPATSHIHDNSAKPVSSIWRSCQCGFVKGRGCVSNGWPSKRFNGEGRLVDD